VYGGGGTDSRVSDGHVKRRHLDGHMNVFNESGLDLHELKAGRISGLETKTNRMQDGALQRRGTRG